MSAQHAIVHHNHTRTFEPISWSDTVGTPDEIIFALGKEKGIELIEKLAYFSSWEYRKAHDYEHFRQGIVQPHEEGNAEAMQVTVSEDAGSGAEEVKGTGGKRKADADAVVEDEIKD